MPKRITLSPGGSPVRALPASAEFSADTPVDTTPDLSPRPMTYSDSAAQRLYARWYRTRTVRAILLSLLAAGAGLLLMRGLFRLLSPAAVLEGLAAHAASIRGSGVNLTMVWLRLLVHRIPLLLLLAAAGLTRFSGALTTTVLVLRGLSDGAAGYCLYTLWRGLLFSSTEAVLPAPGLWLAIFIGASLLGMLLRAVMAAETRGLAVTLSPLPGSSEAGAAAHTDGLHPLLWHHATVTLTVIGGQMALEGLYVMLLSLAF